VELLPKTFGDFISTKDLSPDTKDKDVQMIEEKRGFMPFAVFCPADQGSTRGLGFEMIALLAGVICEGLENSKNSSMKRERLIKIYWNLCDLTARLLMTYIRSRERNNTGKKAKNTTSVIV
jgi:hypothetical protein